MLAAGITGSPERRLGRAGAECSREARAAAVLLRQDLLLELLDPFDPLDTGVSSAPTPFRCAVRAEPKTLETPIHASRFDLTPL
jgi:hypothetical protein